MCPGFCPLPAYVWGRSLDVDWLVTVRPKLGIVFGGTTLAYVTGGLAVGEVKGSWSTLGTTGFSKSGSDSSTRPGWTIGGGLEHALTAHWSIKGEYLYTDLGTFRYDTVYNPGSTFTNPPYRESVKQDLTFSTVRGGLNYKF